MLRHLVEELLFVVKRLIMWKNFSIFCPVFPIPKEYFNNIKRSIAEENRNKILKSQSKKNQKDCNNKLIIYRSMLNFLCYISK
jgi:hypothetical protein